MIKLIAWIYIKAISFCLGFNFVSTGIFLQVIPPTVKREPLVSEAVILAFIQMLTLVGVAFFTNWKANKIKGDVAIVKSEVTTLKEQTDGHMTKLLQLTEEKNQRIGEDIGRDKSKIEHEEQSKKDEASNIAKGKIEGLAEAKAEQTSLPTPSNEPAKVEIVQPEDNPAPVTVIEKKPKNDNIKEK